jgi:hypothetical protein
VSEQDEHAQRTARLKESAVARSADAVARAHRAITVLVNRDVPVTFASVAAEAGVSESFLYKHQELGDRIRQQRKPRTRPKARNNAEAASAASLRVQIGVLADQVEKANEKIRTLTAENEMLRGAVTDLRARQRRAEKQS